MNYILANNFEIDINLESFKRLLSLFKQKIRMDTLSWQRSFFCEKHDITHFSKMLRICVIILQTTCLRISIVPNFAPYYFISINRIVLCRVFCDCLENSIFA